MNTITWYEQFIFCSALILFGIGMLRRAQIAHRLYINTGKWHREVNSSGSTPTYILNTTDAVDGALGVVIYAMIYLLIMIIIGGAIDYPIRALYIVTTCASIALLAFIFVKYTKRERSKKLFCDTLTGE